MISIGIIFSTFLLIFLAELGDKTQLTAFSLTASTKNPLIIFISSSLALVTSSILSAVLGCISSKLLPQITSVVSAVLFLVFGFYLLFSKEMPLIKECFLKTIASENLLLAILPKVFKKHKIFNNELENIIRQDRSHADIFRFLIKQKKFFKDDINRSDKIEGLTCNLDISKKVIKMPFKKALDEIIKFEQSSLDIYEFINEHFDLDHHNEEELQEILKKLIKEENEHIEFFNKIKKRGNHE
ncbi:MAG: TMEM165/GDT1 family protein [Spirochaetes bacterium]|nr:TMEM165/GDT1 family protein [Spirochaetota bacterium]